MSEDQASVINEGQVNDEATNTETATVEPSSFNSLIPEDLRADPALKDFKDVGGLAKSYVNLSKLQGSSIRIPGEDAGSEDLNAFYNKLVDVKGVMRSPDTDNKEAMDAFYTQLGRPETADGYKDSIVKDDVPRGLTFDQDMLSQFKNTAHDLGLTKEQAAGIMEFELGRYDSINQQQTYQLEQARDILKTQWGNEYSNRKSGVSAVKKYYEGSHPEYMTQLEEVAGTNPVLAMIMADAGMSLVEKGHVEAGQAYSGSTPHEAKEKIAEIRNNKEHPWHKGDPAARAKMVKLYEQAYPGQG